jgi:hypothetical protein
MDTVLLAVTILSLAMAVVMAFIVAKLMREERARSDARVNALTALAAEPVAETTLTPPAVVRSIERDAPAPRQVIPERSSPADAPEGGRRTPRLDDLDLRPVEAVAGVSHLFEEPAAPSPWGRRFAVIGGLAAIVVAIAFGVASVQSGGAASPASAAAPSQAPTVLDSAPLELVSLHHSQEADRLVISGLVQNPRSGGPISHVVATAFLFAPDGAFLTSSRAALDFTTLSPGDESAFVINVPVTGQVARYRVGFRTEDGRVIEHVDKRAPDALAQK